MNVNQSASLSSAVSSSEQQGEVAAADDATRQSVARAEQIAADSTGGVAEQKLEAGDGSAQAHVNSLAAAVQSPLQMDVGSSDCDAASPVEDEETDDLSDNFKYVWTIQ